MRSLSHQWQRATVVQFPGSHLWLLETIQVMWKSTSLDVFVLSQIMLSMSPSEAGDRRGALCTLSPEHTAQTGTFSMRFMVT